MNGIVKSINRDKLFGFISPDSGPQYFFHRSDLVDELGWTNILKGISSGYTIRVSFTPVQTPKGPRANDVSLINE
jgi:cold shock CspA family protein